MSLCRLAIVAVFMGCLAACADEDPSERVQRPVSRDEPAAVASILARNDSAGRVIALLFEPATDTALVEDVLRTLRKRQARATFAVTGVWAEQHRDLLFSISAEGHQIINGTYDGRSWTGASTGEAPLTTRERQLALSRAEVTVYRYTSQSTRPYFRPPHDDIDDSVLRDAAANGYGTVVMWTRSSDDLRPHEIVEQAEAGAIIAMRSDDRDADALEGMIDGLRARGFDFVTIGEMSG
jgi:peptidoglycan/xylan/chitin deacetylase (PgdA/CDA1 family)